MKSGSGIVLFMIVVLIMAIVCYCNSQHGVNMVPVNLHLGVVC